MLEFDHVPPRSIEDIKFSEAGEITLRDRRSSEDAMEAYGRLALAQIIVALDPPLTDGERLHIGDIKHHVSSLAEELLADSFTVRVREHSVGSPYVKGPRSIRPFAAGLGLTTHNQGATQQMINKVEEAREHREAAKELAS